MALGTNHVTATRAATFIPEVWSDDIIASRMKRLVVANHVNKITHGKGKGDTIHIPKPVRGSASAKAAETQVTLIANTESEVVITIDKHYHYARMIEDFTEVLALSSLRQFYTQDAGYALAAQVDTDLFNLAEGLQGGTVGAGTWSSAVIGSDGSTAYDQTANTNTGNGAALTDAGLRRIIQTLDDADVPNEDRVLIVPPSERNNLMGISRFTEQAFVGDAGSSNTIRNGHIGELYGVNVFVTSNAPVETAADGITQYRVAMMIHRDAFAYAEAMGVRVQTQNKLEYLGTLLVADTIYGVGELRDDHGVAIVVSA